MSKLKDTKVYSINDFLEWNNSGTLEISPKYQRKSVWNMDAKTYLIDTIIRGLPIPQIFLRQKINTQEKRTYREIIDGQQRINSILAYTNDEFKIKKIQNSKFGNIYFSNLDDITQTNFLNYQIPVEVISTNCESLVYDMFSRVNTNSYTLNKQELRNAKYWGDFKVLAYNLSSEYRRCFEEWHTFTDKHFTRMADVEFISSLLILLIEGIVQDTPSSIDTAYNKYEILDNERLNYVSEKFKLYMGFLKTLLDDNSIKFFKKKNGIYTIFSFLYFCDCKNNEELTEHFESLEKELNKISLNLNRDNLNKTNLNFNRDNLNKTNLIEIESKISVDDSDLKSEFLKKFEEFHTKHTTSKNERLSRLILFSSFLNGDI